MKRKRYRIIVRPWVPRKIPYEITEEVLEKKIEDMSKNLGNVIYLGWKRRSLDGKRSLQYILATGATAREARQNFKNLTSEYETFWVIS